MTLLPGNYVLWRQRPLDWVPSYLCWMMDGLDAEPMIQGDWVTLIQI